MGWLIYILGFLIVYLICKLIRGKEQNKWEDVIITLVLSVCSWAGLFIITLGAIGVYVKHIIENKNPPKWL